MWLCVGKYMAMYLIHANNRNVWNTIPLVSMKAEPLWRWYVDKNRNILYPFEDTSPSQHESDSPSWASAFPSPVTNPVMILSLMMMIIIIMMTLSDGYINTLCRQNAEFSVVKLAVNISDSWSTKVYQKFREYFHRPPTDGSTWMRALCLGAGNVAT